MSRPGRIAWSLFWLMFSASFAAFDIAMFQQNTGFLAGFYLTLAIIQIGCAAVQLYFLVQAIGSDY